jgi:hypothetical protein
MKLLIAITAVLICCMGNEYPAKSMPEISAVHRS